MINLARTLKPSIRCALLTAVLGLGCSNDEATSPSDPGNDASSFVSDAASANPAVSSLSCEQVMSRWNALVSNAELSTCQSDADCTSTAGTSGCGCTVTLGRCGVGVNSTAYNRTEGPALERRFAELSCTIGGMCDCGSVSSQCLDGICSSHSTGCTMGGVPGSL
jgi:hypothetical protein